MLEGKNKREDKTTKKQNFCIHDYWRERKKRNLCNLIHQLNHFLFQARPNPGRHIGSATQVSGAEHAGKWGLL
jgi:hypothetical protein